MAKDEAKVKFSADTADFTAGIAKANSTLTKLRAELKLNATEAKGASDDVDLLAQRQELLAQESQASQAKIEALSQKLEKAKEIFGENSREADKWATQLANARNAEARIQQEIQQVNTALDKQRSSAGSAESALSQLENEISQQKQELSQLANEYKSVVIEQGQSSTEAQKLASKITSLNSDLNKNEQKLKEAEDAADKLGQSFQEAGNDAAQSADGYTMVKDIISDLAADAIQAGIDKLKELGIEGEQALNKLGVKTGATSEQMEKYKGVMDEVYANNYGESFDDVSESISTVVQVLGDMPDDQLVSITQHAMALSDMFDMDVNESVRAANSLMDQFGLSGDQAYNLIAQGAQNGLNQNDDLLDTINEYSVQFADAGYSAEDMFNMLKNGAESGTWSIDKLGDAVKEYNIRMTDGTANEALKELGLDVDDVTSRYAKGGESAKNATNEIITALMGVEDEQERYKLGQEIMGTMWEDLGEDAVQALFKTEGAASKANDTMSDIETTGYDDLGSKLSTLGRMFETEIVGPIKDAVMPHLETLADFFIDNFDTIAPIVVGVGVAFGILAAAMAIQGIIHGVSAAFAILNGVMALNPIFLVIALIAGLVAAFVVAYNKCDWFREMVDKAFSIIKDAISKGVEKFLEFKDKAVEVFKNVKEKADEIAQKFAEFKGKVAEAFEGAKEKVGEVADKIQEFKDKVGEIFGNIKQAVGEVADKFNEFKQNAKDTWDGIKQSAQDGWAKTKESITTNAQAARDKVSETWSNLKNKCSSTWDSVKASAGSAWSNVKSKISNAASGARNSVSNHWNSIKNKTSTAFNAAKNVASVVWPVVKSKITSAAQGAKNSLSSHWDGIKSKTSSAFSSVRNTISTKMSSAKSTLSSAVESMKSKFSGISSISSKAASVFQSVKDNIKSKLDSAKSTVQSFIDNIKSKFPFNLGKICTLQVPQVNVYGGSAPWGIGGKGEKPSFSVSWNAKGGILTVPTLFGMMGNTILGGGEAGPEAILPIERLMGFIDTAFDKRMGAFAGGDTYNVYINDAKINDDAQIQSATRDYLMTLARKGAM